MDIVCEARLADEFLNNQIWKKEHAITMQN